jgi:hypothetical protein
MLAEPARAAQVTGLYEAEVPVTSRDTTAEAAALEAALRTVLIRVAGDPAPERSRSLAPVFKAAQNYVRQFGFKEAREGGQAPLTFWAQFDSLALDSALREAGVRVWGRERPTLLVWLAVSEPGGPRLIGTDNPSAYSEALRAQAATRGVPLLLPLLDLEDETQLSAQDVVAGSIDKIESGSSRYGAEAVLSGSLINAEGGRWTARWSLIKKGQAQHWMTQGDTPQAALGAGIDRAAELLATAYASGASSPTADGTPETLELSVEGISRFDQYAQVQMYLKSLDQVTAVTIKQADAERVLFSVTSRGGAAAVTEAIALGRTLAAVAPERGSYRLLP